MKKFLVLIPFIIILFTGCSSDSVSPTENVQEYGGILFKIDRENAPENIQTVIAFLTRASYDTISASMNLLSDTTADLSLNNIPVGTWHLIVNALNPQGEIVYSGETDVNILPSTTIQVSLTLLPTGLGTGNIYIYVTWGTTQAGWSDYSGNPILTTYQCPGNPAAVKECKVIYDEGKYKMWYMGVFSGATSYAYYAESVDGKNWVHPQLQPVMLPTPGSWDSRGVAPGAVIKDDSVYRMFYSGWDFSGYEQIGMAISFDGKNWTKDSLPIIQPPPGHSIIAVNSAIKVNNKYYLYYGSLDYSNLYKMNVAISLNLESWEIYSGILYPNQQWEGSKPGYPAVIYANNNFRMVYQNANFTAFGEAFSTNGYDWVKNTSNPIITVNQVHNHWCSQIGYPFVFKQNNVYRIYYTGTNASGIDNLAFFQLL
jgi:predicted GH43/DUF377 family glycosyl hydrolase